MTCARSRRRRLSDQDQFETIPYSTIAAHHPHYLLSALPHASTSRRSCARTTAHQSRS
jgi:hypothetical protein